MSGACSDSPNPDHWFPEYPPNRRSYATSERIRRDTLEAISICNDCSIRNSCLMEGLKNENKLYGIWGGKLAGERLLMLGDDIASYSSESEQYGAYTFMLDIYPYMREYYEKSDSIIISDIYID